MSEGKQKVLIVDDELGRDLMAQLLEDDYEIVHGYRLEECIEIVRSQKPAIVLTELTLPLINGWTLIERIRGTEEGKDIPVIAVTAAGMPDDEERAREAGGNDFILKPVDEDDLKERIARLVGV